MYLAILKQQIRFKFRHFEARHVVSRILAYHKTYLDKKAGQIKPQDT